MNKIISSTEEYLKHIEYLKKKYFNHKFPCYLYPKCNESTINSHMFQKNCILSSIATNNKLYVFNYTSLFNSTGIKYELKGLNSILSFNGFCKFHDNKVFEPIEKKQELVNWSSSEAQFLLSYKALALETHRCLVVRNILINSLKTYETAFDDSIKHALSKINDTLKKVLLPYKHPLEKGVLHSDYNLLQFETIVLPFKLELCLTGVFSINDPSSINYNTHLREAYIVNVFPYSVNTIVILGCLNGFTNKWYHKISTMLKSNDVLIISQAFQDILFRTEFHCISCNLHNEIEEDIPKFCIEWLEKKTDYKLDLNIQCNILFKPIENLLQAKS